MMQPKNKIIHIIHHISGKKRKKHMIISINTENAFDSKNHSGQKLSYVKIEGNFINMTKTIYKKPQTKTLQLTCLMVKY